MTENGYTKTLDNLKAELAKLPGIGKRSAERLAFHLLKCPKSEAFRLADAIREMRERIRNCRICYNLCEGEVCNICRDSRRDPTRICVVEQPKDLAALEETGLWNGLYHVLLGHLAPIEGVEPKDLTIASLVERVRKGGIEEVLLATNPNFEGDGTNLYIMSQLKDTGVKVTRLARGMPSGSAIEYVNLAVLTDALSARQEFENE
jgi:recombination protein RecR